MKGKNCLRRFLGVVIRSQGTKLNNRKCSFYIYRVFLIVIFIKLWNGFIMEVVEKLFCKLFYIRVDKVFKDIFLERNLFYCCDGGYNE